MFETRNVEIGGASKAALLAELVRAAVRLNDAAHQLFDCDAFTTASERRSLAVVELAVRDLGCPEGGTIAQIEQAAFASGLALAPVELGPHLRLQYLDQPEGAVGQPITQHRAPPGSLTVMSPALSDDDGFPKGFYLRRIEGVLWLRGYRSGADHRWQPDDRLVFCA